MRFNTGTVEGTGAALNVTIGFIPRLFIAWNIDGDCSLVWNSSMTDAHAFVMNGSTEGEISSAGITPLDPDSTVLGVTIGGDSNVNANGETMIWAAWD